MHPDLVAISNVWHADVRVDTLRAEHEHLVALATGSIQAHKDSLVARDTAKAAAAAARVAERVNNRELDSYTNMRGTTARMLNDGSAPDYPAAERQLANCRAKVDALETVGLDLLEQVDAAVAAVKSAEDAVGAAAAAEHAARHALGARDGGLRVELTGALADREATWKLLPQDFHVPYNELRRRKRPALVNFQDNTCVVCHMRVAPQKANEVQLNRVVHTCVGCGGYLLPGT